MLRTLLNSLPVHHSCDCLVILLVFNSMTIVIRVVFSALLTAGRLHRRLLHQKQRDRQILCPAMLFSTSSLFEIKKYKFHCTFFFQILLSLNVIKYFTSAHNSKFCGKYSFVSSALELWFSFQILNCKQNRILCPGRHRWNADLAVNHG